MQWLINLLPIAVAAPGEWAWEAGSRSAGGAPANASVPVARCCAQSWTASAADGAPQLYLFGGSSDAFIGDFWRLDPARPRDGWRNIPSGGSLVPNSGGNASIPSARSYAVTWTRVRDGSDELWMWGGYGCNSSGDIDGHLLSDMWSWTVGEGEAGFWTQRLQGDAPRPSPRNWANFWSVDGGSTLYVHSGMGGQLTPWGGFAEPFSDMWRFDVDERVRLYEERACRGVRRRHAFARVPFERVHGGGLVVAPSALALRWRGRDCGGRRRAQDRGGR